MKSTSEKRDANRTKAKQQLRSGPRENSPLDQIEAPPRRANGPAEARIEAGHDANHPTPRPTPTPAPGHNTFHFEVRVPAARSVCIAGNFNDWTPEGSTLTRLDNDRWGTDLTLPPGVYEYRLVIDGKWTPDPNAARSVPNPFGEPNSLLVISSPAGA